MRQQVKVAIATCLHSRLSTFLMKEAGTCSLVDNADFRSGRESDMAHGESGPDAVLPEHGAGMDPVWMAVGHGGGRSSLAPRE